MNKLRSTGILLLAFASCLFAQVDDNGVQHRENRWSLGAAAGFLSGYCGVTGRYWGEQWGGQLTLLPIMTYNQDRKTSDGMVMGGVQLMRRLNVEPPRLHEASGYVHSIAYEYLGFSLYHELGDANSYQDVLVSTGVGLGLETYWRNWRLATGVGMQISRVNDDNSILTPSLDVSLTYGL